MKITKELINRLMDSDGSTISIDFKDTLNSRTNVECIIDNIKATGINNVVEIGCGTHPNKIREKLWDKKLLFATLIQDFKVMGLDNNIESINTLKDIGYEDVFYSDFIGPKPRSVVNAFYEDVSYVVLLADKLEHTENPINFLKEIRKTYGKPGNKLVISVPNAYAYQRIVRLMEKGLENVDVDHKFMFTPMTLLKNIVMAGLIPESIDFAGYYDVNSNDMSFKLKDYQWMMGHTIVVTCDLSQ